MLRGKPAESPLFITMIVKTLVFQEILLKGEVGLKRSIFFFEKEVKTLKERRGESPIKTFLRRKRIISRVKMREGKTFSFNKRISWEG